MRYFAWPLHSRIQKLNFFPNDDCYVKRDDELSFGISGCKYRKYASLIPYLLDNNYQHLCIIGTQQANNLLAALQLAREYQLDYKAFVLRAHQQTIVGNFKLSQLFLTEDNIQWIERGDWKNVEKIAGLYQQRLNKKSFLLKEGANVPPALRGAKSLAFDIKQNEKTLGKKFKHLFIEAGTGLSAIGLLQGLKEINHHAKVHILLLAEDEKAFKKNYYQLTGDNNINADIFYPMTAKSFGAVNKTILKEIKRSAMEEGLLLDPIYSAKLFYHAREKIEKENLKGPILIIHSGGALSLTGFEL